MAQHPASGFQLRARRSGSILSCATAQRCITSTFQPSSNSTCAALVPACHGESVGPLAGVVGPARLLHARAVHNHGAVDCSGVNRGTENMLGWPIRMFPAHTGSTQSRSSRLQWKEGHRDPHAQESAATGAAADAATAKAASRHAPVAACMEGRTPAGPDRRALASPPPTCEGQQQQPERNLHVKQRRHEPALARLKGTTCAWVSRWASGCVGG